MLNSGSNETADDYQAQIQSELDQSRKALNEVSMMLEQSQAEISKLTQRSAVITGHLQQVQAQFDSMPRADIRNAYNAALDAQQRLLVMRGQLEKLQSDESHLKKLIRFLEEASESVNEGKFNPSTRGKSSGSHTLEMVIKAQEAERQRLSRLMHDGPAQALSNFIVQTEIASRFLELDSTRAKEELTNLKNSAMTTFQKVRGFIFELRPMMLDDLGLYPTIRRYVDTYMEQTGHEVTLNFKGTERRLEPYLEVMIFRALQELLANASHHNEENPGKLQITVMVSPDDSMVKVSVSDNGKGFDPASIEDGSGLGLKVIRERAEILGGFMEIDSAVGQGCKVTFQVPSLDIEKAIQ